MLAFLSPVSRRFFARLVCRSAQLLLFWALGVLWVLCWALGVLWVLCWAFGVLWVLCWGFGCCGSRTQLLAMLAWGVARLLGPGTEGHLGLTGFCGKVMEACWNLRN